MEEPFVIVYSGNDLLGAIAGNQLGYGYNFTFADDLSMDTLAAIIKAHASDRVLLISDYEMLETLESHGLMDDPERPVLLLDSGPEDSEVARKVEAYHCAGVTGMVDITKPEWEHLLHSKINEALGFVFKAPELTV